MKRNVLILALLFLLISPKMIVAQNIEDTALFKMIGVIHSQDFVVLTNNDIRSEPSSENLQVVPYRNGEKRTIKKTANVLYRRYAIVNKQDIESTEMLTEDYIKNLIYDKKAFLDCDFALNVLNYILASPQCDTSLITRLRNSYDFKYYPIDGWYYCSITPKYRIINSESIFLNEEFSYCALKESDYLIVETTYLQYRKCLPETEYEDFVLAFWLDSSDYERTIRLAIPLLK